MDLTVKTEIANRRIFLIDFENVHEKGLEGIGELSQNDAVHLGKIRQIRNVGLAEIVCVVIAVLSEAGIHEGIVTELLCFADQTPEQGVLVFGGASTDQNRNLFLLSEIHECPPFCIFSSGKYHSFLVFYYENH